MRRILLAGLVLAAGAAGPVRADTLRETFARVYGNNPTLLGARANLRSVDENSAIARAQGLPDLAATGNYNEFLKRSANSFSAPRRAAGGAVNLQVPVYSGGQVRNGIKAADARVDAGRGQLRSTEANLFSETVAAYMDVIRDQSIVELNAGNVRVLETNARASRDRFEVGDLTRTDVAQSDARLELARSQLVSAQAQLEASRENYLRIVGKFPENLEPPPPLPAFPPNPDDAVDIAVENNPALETVRQQSKAADYDIGVARSLRLPRISAFANADYTDYLGTLGNSSVGAVFVQRDKTATAGVQASLPLFQGGEPGARVRQAQAAKSVALENITATERSVVADTRTAYARFRASEDVIRSSEVAVSANELALEGTRAEQGVGTRNLLDVLNAEQELLNSRVTLVSARRDAYVAGFTLLASMGKAEARDLGLDSGPLYDPDINYRRVRHRINDWDSDPRPQPVASRTVGLTSTQPAVAPAPEATREGTKNPATTPPVTTPVTAPKAAPPPAGTPVTSPRN
ncbi:TolC family outer membrane protein [Sphingomonas profundi]|uniref:TolC family outer membrane protein n=1 Tax=Alterirhizorhabdus profundi TaxID=2681549 RepID=UPI0012E7545B|nr:TolC family outer membrane protein [Sphingomonas profundi]